MKIIKSIRAMVVVIALLSAADATADQAGDICGARFGRSASIGARVSFHGTVLSDGMHSTVIKPDRCKSEGYAMSAEGTRNDDPALIIRNAVMQVGGPGTLNKDIVVDVDAVVVILPNGAVGVRLVKLNRMVLTYPANDKGS